MNGTYNQKKYVSRAENLCPKVVLFEQEASYYYLKGSYYLHRNKPSKARLFFKKAMEVEPDNPLHHYNMACLLSKTNQLEEANHIFKHIVSKLDPEMTECYFLMAVNCGLLEDLEMAKGYLRKYIELSPEGEMAEEAVDLIFALEEEESLLEPVAQMTLQENEELLKEVLHLGRTELKQRFQEDRYFKDILLKGLYQGSDQLKEEVIRICGQVGPDSIYCLRQFVANPWIKERFRQMALLVLKNLLPAGKCRIYHQESFVEVDLYTYPVNTPVWEKSWQDVLSCTLNHMRQNSYYTEEFYEDVLAIWLDFINQVYPDVPRIIKPQTWGAGLEYSLARFHFLNLTQKELASKYGVSLSSVGAKFKVINQVLQIDQKAYRNMISILTRREWEQN
ncbi:MAG TPA: tetratricopeptide repeat protein [Firmicutes bacterium]|nr:tetratricopeptide repeat protein [Bacillota bacterium]